VYKSYSTVYEMDLQESDVLMKIQYVI